MEDLIAVGTEYGIDKKKAEKATKDIYEIVNDRLERYLG